MVTGRKGAFIVFPTSLFAEEKDCLINNKCLPCVFLSMEGNAEGFYGVDLGTLAVVCSRNISIGHGTLWPLPGVCPDRSCFGEIGG